MSDRDKTEAQLSEELQRLRRRIVELEQEREQTRDRNETILRTCSDGFWLVDQDGHILEVNDAYCRMSGYTRDELLTMSIQDLEAVETAEEVTHHIQEIIARGTHRFESCQRRKDGTIMDLDISTHRLRSDAGKVFTFMRDITEHKEAEEALRHSEERYRSVIEDSPGLVCRFLPDGEIVFVNAAYCEYFGKNTKELIGKKFTSLIPEEDRQAVLDRILSLTVDSPSMTHEHKVTARDGQIRWQRWTNRALFDDRGRAVAFQSFGEDITEWKNAEEAVRASRDLLEKTFRSLDSAVFILDCEIPPCIIDCNPAACSIFGYEKNQMLGQTTDFLHVSEETLLEFQRTLFPAVKEQGHLSSFEFRMKRKNGEIFPSEHAVFPLQNENGERIGWISVIRDITERRKRLQTIRENQSLIQGILDNTSSVIAVRDIRGRYIMVNREAQDVLGMDSCDILNKNPHEIHTREHAEKILADDKMVFDSRTPLPIEDQLKVKGEMRAFLGTRFPLLNAAGEPYAVCTVATDISERKKVEDALLESEARYRTLVESAGEAIATIDNNGVFTFMNTTGAKRLGGTPKDFVGKTMWDLFPKEVAGSQMVTIKEVIRTGRGANVIVPTELAGQVRWYNTTVEPLKDGVGEISSAMIIARDIHELRQAVEQIHILSSAVEQSIDGVAIGDLEARLLYVNEAYARLHGYAPKEMIGMRLADLCSDKSASECMKAVQKTEAQGSWTGEVEHVRKDGTIFFAYVSVTLLKDQKAVPTGILSLCRDMTETRKKEEELAKYRTQMARAEQLASLGTLSATVAHQITQPLTVIRLSLDNAIDELEASSCSHKIVRKLQDSVTQVSNITAIINRFRSFARQSSDTWSGPVSVSAIAVRVVRLLYESARQAKVMLRLKGMGRLPPASINETDLEQLFFALLENAIQAADGIQVRQVVISGALKQERIELCFRDTCGGIAPENRARVFEPFFTTKPRGQGTGLGLCIVQDVVTRVGGRIRLEIEPGKGTTFFVTLPVDKDTIS